MRSLVSFMLGVLTIALLALAVPGLWFERSIIDESGYVALVAPLGEDPEFQAALADTVTAAVISNSSLGSAGRRIAEPVVQRIADGMTQLNGFDEAWTESNQLSHRINVTDIPPAETEGRLAVDLTPMVALVTNAANQRIGRDLLSAPDDLIVSVGTPEHRGFVDRARDVAPWAWALAAVAAALAVGCLGVARRRGTALIGLGAGVLLLAAAQLFTVTSGGERAVDSIAARAGFGQTLLEHLHGAVVSSYGVWLFVLALLGVLAVVVGAVIRVRK